MGLFSLNKNKKKKNRQVAPRRRISDTPNVTDASTLQLKRTLVGTRSHEVSSAKTTHDHFQTPRVKKHSLRRRQRYLQATLSICVLSIAFLGYCLYELIGFVDVRIATNSSFVQTVSKDKTNEYKNAIQEYFGLHPTQRFRSLLNVKQLHAYLNESSGYSEIAGVHDVFASGVAKSTITIDMRVPVAQFGSTDSRYVDSSGIVFKDRYHAAPSITIVDEAFERGVQSTQASSRFIGFIGRIVAAIEKQGITINQVIIPSDAIRYVELETKDNVRIRVTIDRSVFLQAEDAGRAMSHLRGKGISADVVDVRIANKVFYTIQ